MWGLFGTGVALAVMSVVDFIMLAACMRVKYGFKFSTRVMNMAARQLPIGLLAYALSWMKESILYYTLGLILAGISAFLSFQSLKKKTRLMQYLKQRFH